MGYLNYNLEKIASIVEGGMEKQALSLSKLVGMGVNAANRGKLGHFAKRLEQRNRAMKNVSSRRWEAFNKAIPESNLERAFLGAKDGVASLNARRLGHRTPMLGDGAATTSSNINNFLRFGDSRAKQNFARMLTRREPVLMDAQNLGKITKEIRTFRPELLKQITAGKNLTATAKSPVDLRGKGGAISDLTDDLFQSGYRY